MISILLDPTLDITVRVLLFGALAISIIIAIGIHEYAHAYMADRLGDPTPGLQGRLTLNPIRHLDPVGTILIFLIGFGWGKPVMFDPFNLRDPRRDAALIAVAGPVTNFIMAAMGSAVLYALFWTATNLFLFEQFLQIFIQLNIALGVFNLIPVSPLDGFKIVGGLLPEEQSREWYGLERFGFIFLLVLIFPIGDSSMIGTILGPVIGFFMSFLIPGAL